MRVNIVFRYFAIAFFLNENLICGSILKKYLIRNDQLNLLDLLKKDNVDIRRIDSNEAEELVKEIVKEHRISNDRHMNKIPLHRVIPTDYELVRGKINEGVFKNYVTEDLSAEKLLSTDGKKEGLITQDYELVRGVAKNNERKFKKNAIRSIPPDYESSLKRGGFNGRIQESNNLLQDLLPEDKLINNEGQVENIIPPDYKLAKDLIPPDYELIRDRNIRDLIPPDYELVRNRKIKGFIPPDYELVRHENINSFIPPDYELVRDRKIKGLIPPDYELVRNGKIKDTIPPDYELVRHGRTKGLIPPDYELVGNGKIQGLIPPDYELAKHGIIKGFIPPDYELVSNGKTKGVIPLDYELVRNGKIMGTITPDYDLVRDRIIKDLIPSDNELSRHGKIKGLVHPSYDLVEIMNNDKSINSLDEILSNDVKTLSKVLVKRLIPRDYESPLVEYDHRNNAYFKPLIRLIKRRPINYEPYGDEDILVRSPDEKSLLEPFGLYDKRDKKYNNKSFSKRHTLLSPQEHKRALNLVKHIRYLVSNINSPQLKRLTLDRILDVLHKVENLRQGDIENPDEEQEEVQRQPPPLSAYVPFFNYWTYQKTVVEDDCPDNSVKIGNVCSRIPPHRSGKHKQ